MEDLGKILRRMADKYPSRDGPVLSEIEETPDLCGLCSGREWLTTGAAVGDPDFGRAIACTCQKQDDESSRYERLLKYSNLGNLSRFTFERVESKNVQITCSRISYERAFGAALEFAEDPLGWIVLQGPHGAGKTMLAAAIGNRCISRGHVVFFSHVPDLLDHLRATFSPTSDIAYSDLFEQVKSAPILVLDGLGSYSTTPWAEEKLGQIVNHRHNAELPTVYTSAVPLHELDTYVSTRLRSPGFSRVVEIEAARDRSDGPLGGIDPQLLERMTFEAFDVRGNNPSDAQRVTLEYAFQAASRFADSPEGWLILTGETGTGKTHLAYAIAGVQLELDNSAIFAFVPDLMDHLRRTFDPQSPIRYDRLFEEVRSTPLLILDDFGKERKSDWAVEKLYQIVVHRHNLRLPTVITCAMELEDVGGDPILSRILDESIKNHYVIEAPDYRKKMRPVPRGRKPR